MNENAEKLELGWMSSGNSDAYSCPQNVCVSIKTAK